MKQIRMDGAKARRHPGEGPSGESSLDRRHFLARMTTAGSGFAVLRSGALRAGNSPNDRLNLAIIGVGGRGRANMNGVKVRDRGFSVQADLTGLKGQNIAALCDVNEVVLAEAAKQFPEAKTYTDWRRCLDQKDLDAVVCSTADHTHAFINLWAMNRGLSVYCEKPLANSVGEVRLVRETYLKHRDKIATQMGIQMHSTDEHRRSLELIRRGAIGTPREVHVWCGRRPLGGSYLPESGPPPSTLHWDLWIGPSSFHPYNPGYLGNCLNWNRFWDFGSGQMGDMASHMMDLAYWALDLRFPTTCRATGPEFNPDTCPRWLTAEWEHPANDWRPAVKVFWYDGGKKPTFPLNIFRKIPDIELPEDGALGPAARDPLYKGILFAGDEGWLLTDLNTRMLIPKNGQSHLAYYSAPKPQDLIPPSPGHHDEWIEGCKTGRPTGANFDYSGMLVEHNLLALVAYRAGKKIEWDAERLVASNCPEADQFIHRKYRDGWTLNG